MSHLSPVVYAVRLEPGYWLGHGWSPRRWWMRSIYWRRDLAETAMASMRLRCEAGRFPEARVVSIRKRRIKKEMAK